MNTAQGSIGVKAPIGKVYRLWLRFEDFPQLVTAVKEVERLDSNHFFMAAVCNGKRIEGVLEIMLRVPDRRVAWRLVAGKSRCDHLATGVASFTSQSDRSTRVNLKISYSTLGGDLCDRIDKYLRNFKQLVERREGRKRNRPQFADNSAATKQASSVKTVESPNL